VDGEDGKERHESHAQLVTNSFTQLTPIWCMTTPASNSITSDQCKHTCRIPAKLWLSFRSSALGPGCGWSGLSSRPSSHLISHPTVDIITTLLVPLPSQPFHCTTTVLLPALSPACVVVNLTDSPPCVIYQCAQYEYVTRLATPLTPSRLTCCRTAANRIGIFTIDFPDPAIATNFNNNKFNTLNDSISFSYRISGNTQTLSTKGVSPGTDPYGILYVPELQSDGCKTEEEQHVEQNVTRIANLPRGRNYALIAVAPWFSPQCMLEYFVAARRSPTKAIFVYQPGQGNARPPVLNDASWNLQDGGQWQSDNTFPTYALSTMTGENIMDQLAQYSGNLTDVPNGDRLATVYEKSDYVRLWSTVVTDADNQIPSLWVFLVIVLAILIVAVSGTSIAMHILQRKRRRDLRRRVLRGEVDLEALGVKRLNVSQETLDKLPIYTYTGTVPRQPGDLEKPTPQAPAPVVGAPSSSIDAEAGVKTAPLVRRSSDPTTTTAPSDAWSQGSCPICLDDFEPNETQVRELPCRHIFHPDCIDQFLLRNSSLCPMCKQSVQPIGACPEITNMMVRRERHITRMRERGTSTAGGSTAHRSGPFRNFTAPIGSRWPLGRRIGGTMTGRRIFSAPERTRPPPPADIEMANSSAPTTTTAAAPVPPHEGAPPSTNTQDCTPTQNRREWARQRALQLLGNRNVPTSDVEEENSRPRWRRTLNRVFPGFR